MKELNLIAAVADNYVIGANGKMPWHISEDFKLFKKNTVGSAIIMGSTTYQSIGKPLPDRLNIVLSRSMEQLPGIIIARNLDEAIHIAEQERDSAFVIGGSKVYSDVVDRINFAYISHVKGHFEGDTFFPKVDFSTWNIVDEQEYDAFTFKKYLVNQQEKIN